MTDKKPTLLDLLADMPRRWLGYVSRDGDGYSALIAHDGCRQADSRGRGDLTRITVIQDGDGRLSVDGREVTVSEVIADLAERDRTIMSLLPY